MNGKIGKLFIKYVKDGSLKSWNIQFHVEAAHVVDYNKNYISLTTTPAKLN